MVFERSSGILLHPTSFPSRFGVGDLGKSAYKFIDFLESAGQRLWQVLPLGPTGYADSPYQSFSAFAGNTLLISPEKLVEMGLVEKEDIESVPEFTSDYVEFDKARAYKNKIFYKAYKNFVKKAEKTLVHKFERFCDKNKLWIDDYALFTAVKEHFGEKIWTEWDKDIAKREAKAVEQYKKLLKDKIEYYKFIQFIFSVQWMELKSYANGKDIKIIGDIPIFVAYDSADVWANPGNFKLNKDGRPIGVAGVPPDFFTATGQLWGNPLYNWDKLKEDGYKWWINRIKFLTKSCDIIRIDHFRGFAGYWEVPYGEKTAINGEWKKGPGADLFTAIEKALGKLPIIAEDLGLITEDVIELRDKFEFPGMNILQFAFDGSDNQFLPHNHKKNSVVYTGTHDNETTWAFFKGMPEANKKNVMEYFNTTKKDSSICWEFIRWAFASPANFAVIPLQDVLCLDNKGRMNTPGTVGGNWGWRYKQESLTTEIEDKLLNLTSVYKR